MSDNPTGYDLPQLEGYSVEPTPGTGDRSARRGRDRA